ncbi:MAG: Gfo/Idh/MocA family oxidoreductase [Merismopedia sp. SIO2A8]|nr:Gfo/Idh/MocA family oxidoreductase [Symploca sp. SIO2B6]NET48330.1 Gfo/Idh/MocA family oxidoreductase [Merismopedia sp. SIO2A8]
MAQSPIGVGIVGTGFGQKVHIPGFQAHPRTEVMAVYHRDLEKAKAIAHAHNIPHACQTVQELVALPEIKAVSISTPPFLHYDMAKTVIQAKKHLLLEKPTSMTVAEAQELEQMAIAHNIVSCLDFEFRFVPAWQRFAELLNDGVVGVPRLIKIDWLASSRASAERAWNWYAQKSMGGGALGALGSHTFDYVPWLFGPVRRVLAHLSTTIKERPDPTTGTRKTVDSDDVCQIMLELADGISCQISISAVTYAGRGHWIEVYGDRGTLILGNDSQTDYINGFRIWSSQTGGPLTEEEIPTRLQFEQDYPDGRISAFVRVIDHWLQDMNQGRSSAPSLTEGVYSQLLMDCTHQSSESAQWVVVPD